MAQEAIGEISKAYNPADVEERIFSFWMENATITPNNHPQKPPFVLIMPPPNVTGELHLGHALTAAVEDVLCRWHRMLGDSTLWLPGKDHAGIATQWVVEQQLARQGTSRQELGREKFLEQVWEWVRKYGNTIDEQHKRLGTSCDWSRLRFTLDPGPSRAVRTTFVNLYEKGLIYKGERLINWCVRCSTALSDLEVEHEELNGNLYHIRYPLADGPGHITVATTRPETMLGDTAVAVHPDDPRYSSLVGQSLVLPVMGRGIPVIADPALDPEFGTGALKVTPGHDPTDFEIGQRHNLPVVTVIGPDGAMTSEAGPYEGRERFECREGIVNQLETEGLIERIEPYRHSVGHCQRCKTVVEPLVSIQWFMNVGTHDDPDSIAGRAYRAVTEDRIRIVPERFGRVYLNWLENIRDWCISRQLWWGHRIPVWYCRDCQGQTVSIEDPDHCEHCASTRIWQDPDVLDTWFSSGLWTHSTLGWPEDTDDMRYFYPRPDHDHATQGYDSFVMETGYDIIFFWVARMIMMGLANTGREPFHTVFLHGLIRDTQGVKMSKTKGNVLDPLQLIDQFGTDALRFALTTGTAPGNDLRLGESKLESSRNFANKLWNAARFVVTSLEGVDLASLAGWYDPPETRNREDRWILHRLNLVVSSVNGYLREYELGEAQRVIYEFLWGEFCDWYIEMAKVRLRSGDTTASRVLAHVLERTLRLLHPFMPFITEEIWQNLIRRLPNEGDLPESIMNAPYPESNAARIDHESESEMLTIILMIRAIRNARAQLHIPSGQRLEATVDTNGLKEAVEEESPAIRTLARVEPLYIIDGSEERPPAGEAMTLVIDRHGSEVPLVVTLPLAGVVDLSAERVRLNKELEECDAGLERVRGLLSNSDFSSKAPEEVVEREQERLNSLQERRERLQEILTQLP
ncbi:MAG: valine--tRNA ligase [Dehalococcoidia bacterium]|nr:valine--tRNA ligase [Dehalococcoidia bacterium]